MIRSGRKKTDISDNKDYMSKQRLFTPTHGTKKIRINAKSIDSKDRYWIGDGTKETRNTLEKTKGYFEDISSIFDIPSKIVIAPQHKLAGIAAYDHKTDILYISNLLHSEKSVKNLLSSGYFAANKFNDIISHELAHKLHWDRVKLFAKSKGLSYNIFEAKEELEAQLRKYLKEQEMQYPHYISKTISRNAEIHFKNGSLNELIADSIVKLENNKLKDDMLIKLVKGVLGL